MITSILAAVLAVSAAPPPAPIPDTPAGRRFADLMALTDAKDEGGIAVYVRENFTAGMQKSDPGDPGMVPFLVEHTKNARGFKVVRAISAADDQVAMLVRPRTQANRWIRYVVKVEAAPPHLVEGLFLMPASPGDIPTEGEALTPDAAVTALATEVDRVVASGRFSGVVLLAKGEAVAYQHAAGEADREHHVPVKADTVFGLASMNKMFTAVAMGRLVEQGRVAWSDPVGKHLRGWLPADREKTITIEQLLTHTAGLGDYLDRLEDDPKLRAARTLSAYRDLVRTSTVAGTSRTGSWCRDEVIENRAIGYLPPDEAEVAGLGHGWRSHGLLQGTRGTSAGGGFSTAGDLLRFARALVEGRLVKRETLDALLKPRVRFPVGGSYGYGFVGSEGQVSHCAMTPDNPERRFLG